MSTLSCVGASVRVGLCVNVCCLALLGFFPNPALSLDSQDREPVQELEPVVVTATKTPVPLS